MLLQLCRELHHIRNKFKMFPNESERSMVGPATSKCDDAEPDHALHANMPCNGSGIYTVAAAAKLSV